MLWVAAITTAMPAAAQLEPTDVARLRHVEEVALAPDGSAVAYALEVPRTLGEEEDGKAWIELHVAAWDGTSRRFVSGKERVHDLAWSADSAAIAYLAEREGDEHDALYLIPRAGGESRRVLRLETEIEEFALSPDGERVAVLADEPPGERQRAAREAGFSQTVYAEGEPFVRVWIARLDGEGGTRMLDLPGSASELHWSPAGDRLAVALAPTPLVDDEYTRRQIHVVAAATGEVLGPVEARGKLGEVAWSPDGGTLAVISAVDRHDPREGRLMVTDADGGELTDRTPDLPGHVQHAAWLDSRRLLLSVAEGVRTVLYELDATTGERRLLDTGGDEIWSAISVSAGGERVALAGESASHPAELYLWAPGVDRPRRVTDSNPWLAERRLGRQEVVTWTARDGLELEGVLIRPLERAGDRPVPLVLYVHGGPESHVADGWLTSYSRPGQMAASRGMAVLHPNYRGSTGRGLEFSKLSQGEPGGAEFDDLIDAVDHFVRSGLADPEHIGITGGSYGGYATAWATTRYSDRFAAGVMFVGISDQMFSTLEGDIPHEHRLVHMLAWPWEHWQRMLEASPIYHAGNARTPLLIAGGTADTRVNPSQSLALYNTLKARSSAPVRYVTYPEERHGNERAAARLDYSLRMMRWLEHYLIGPGGAPPDHRLDYGTLIGLSPDREQKAAPGRSK